MQRIALIAIVTGLGLGLLLGAGSSAAPPEDTAPLLVLTGRESDLRETSYRLARSQEIFDEIWIAHAGDRVTRAAQGWPMTPQIDFDACDVVFAFGGDRVNSNGYRVVAMHEEHDAITVRVDQISYQTSSFDGRDSGEPARPWMMMVIPHTTKTILLEENVQNIIGREPVWKQRAAFPGVIGVGRVVPGTRQSGG